MRKILLTVIGLSIATVTHAADIEYKTIAQCQQAMDSYIKQAEKLSFSKRLAFTSWFWSFRRSESSINRSCVNNQCITTFNLGGCGTINGETRFLYNLVKPLLINEIERLRQQSNSLLPKPKFAIVCKHAKNTPPMKHGQCKLV